MKKLPFIPVQPPEMTAELAGQQYKMMFNDAVCGENKTKYYRIFHNMITRLLYSNFKYTGLKPYESKMIEYYLINEGRVTAIRTHFDIESNTPDNIFYGRFSSGESINELIEIATTKNITIFQVLIIHKADKSTCNIVMKKHNFSALLEGSDEANLLPDIKFDSSQEIIVKTRQRTFIRTNFEEKLKKKILILLY